MLIPGNNYNCRSQYVSDGDTLNLTFQNEVFNARLQWIDTPETRKNGQNSNDLKINEHWLWAEKAKTVLTDLVKEKQIITIPIVKDLYGRWVCDCYIERVSVVTNLQIILCKLGMAVSYLPFNRFSYTIRELTIIRGIITEIANANRRKIGIWSVPDLILPYEFKKLKF